METKDQFVKEFYNLQQHFYDHVLWQGVDEYLECPGYDDEWCIDNTIQYIPKLVSLLWDFIRNENLMFSMIERSDSELAKIFTRLLLILSNRFVAEHIAPQYLDKIHLIRIVWHDMSGEGLRKSMPLLSCII